MFFHRSEGPSPRPFGCADPIPVRSPACRGSGSWTHASKRACRARTIRAACRYGTLTPLVVTGRVFGCAARVRGSRVSATGDLDLRPPDRYPYRFHIDIPKYASNGTEPFGGGRMCPSMQDDKTCTMTKDGASGEYTGVTLSGGHKDPTSWHQNTATVLHCQRSPVSRRLVSGENKTAAVEGLQTGITLRRGHPQETS